jgi:hypothetical protein
MLLATVVELTGFGCACSGQAHREAAATETGKVVIVP